MYQSLQKTKGDRVPAPQMSSRRSGAPPVGNAINASRLQKPTCACGGGCPRCQGSILTSSANDAAFQSASSSTGKKLPPVLRSSLEQRVGQSLSSIQIHDDHDAHARVQQQGALAYASGRDIYFGAGTYQPQTPVGDWVIGHEVTHAVQQGLADTATTPLSKMSQTSDNTLEDQAHKVASGKKSQVNQTHAPAIMALTPAQFRSQLGNTPQQAFAINTLFTNTSFLDIWNWLGGCATTPQQDQGPLALRATPGLASGGIVRFGGYSPMSATLEINPTKPEHVNNPAELVDTVFHELIHAADDLNAGCQATGSPAAPLGGAVTSILPSRASVAGTPTETNFNIAQGPGASNPCGEFIDINAAAQSMVTAAIQSNIQLTGVGQPTLTFVNMIIRSNAAALTAYETCRTAACALSGAAKTTALGSCSRETIAQFLPNSMLSAFFPSHLRFDTGLLTLRSDQTDKLDFVARYLVHHSARTIEIVGHTDTAGSGASNMVLGQQRADQVRLDLIGRGVPSSQIRRTRSEGETSTVSTSTSQNWRDRRVEIRF